MTEHMHPISDAARYLERILDNSRGWGDDSAVAMAASTLIIISKRTDPAVLLGEAAEALSLDITCSSPALAATHKSSRALL